MGRVFDPSPFGMWTRRTGGARYVPDGHDPQGDVHRRVARQGAASAVGDVRGQALGAIGLAAGAGAAAAMPALIGEIERELT